ncbi:hypothetical protein C2S52_002327 [Perilla frutescens var. hirtella]|nr:hypothetical protein C2S52_002327 [Perilla frutescens var. hirtella]
MGIATTTLPPVTSHSKVYSSLQFLDKQNLSNSMSQDYHQGIFSFSNGFERSQQEQQQHHIAQQIRRDKLRVQGFEPPPPPLVGMEEEESTGLPVYETAGMLSEMFSFPAGGGATATELLESQILQSYRNPRGGAGGGAAADWFSQRQGMVVGGDLGESKNQQHQISSINADSAAAMQLFLMNPQQQQQRSPSPSPSSHPPPQSTSSTLHMLMPHPSSSSSALHALSNASGGGGGGGFGQFTWLPNSGGESNPSEISGVVEGQGLSLSLSSSLQHLEAAKAEELRMGEGNMLFFGQGGGGSTPAQYHQLKNIGGGHNHQLHVGLTSSSYGTVNMLRNSKYAKAAQELLEEFCSVGRGHFKKNKLRRPNNHDGNPTSAAAGNSSSSSKDNPPLSAADRLEHQRRKVKLLSMLDEARGSEIQPLLRANADGGELVRHGDGVRRGGAVHIACAEGDVAAFPVPERRDRRPAEAQLRAAGGERRRHLRRHQRRDAAAEDARSEPPAAASVPPNGNDGAGSLAASKGFARAIGQHFEGLAFRAFSASVRSLSLSLSLGSNSESNVLFFFGLYLRYPSDADKHLLARQTGLSRNQVSNWFINARVRLWKPMVEEMYQQEAKDESGCNEQLDRDQSSGSAQTPTPNAATTTTISATTAITPPPPPKRSSENATAQDNDPSYIALNRQQQQHCFTDNQATNTVAMAASGGGGGDQPHDNNNIGSTLIRFGTNSGDVSLTLGLRHAGNLPEKSPFSVRDFGGC